jgi:hypothetical protein
LGRQTIFSAVLPVLVAFAGPVSLGEGICPGWEPVGNGLAGGVRAMADFDGDLVVGGTFQNAGDWQVNFISYLSDDLWQPLCHDGDQGACGLDGPAFSLFPFDDGNGLDLYVGGAFVHAGGQFARGIARWDGTAWGGLNEGVEGTVHAMTNGSALGPPTLYVGGSFTVPGLVGCKDPGGCPNVAFWNGQQWAAVGQGLNGTVRALQFYVSGSGNNLYAVGDFTFPGGGSHVARLVGETWQPVEGGFNFPAFTMSVFNEGGTDHLFVGGLFNGAGFSGMSANRIARFDGLTWSNVAAPLSPNGLDRNMLASTVFDDGEGEALYVGGLFTEAGGESAGRIARWDGSEWSDVRMGADNLIASLITFEGVDGDALYAGGDFSMIGFSDAIGIAQWQPPPGGDFDCDGDVDLVDFSCFTLCFTGIGGGPVGPECEAGDFDGDGDVDLSDFSAFQIIFG